MMGRRHRDKYHCNDIVALAQAYAALFFVSLDIISFLAIGLFALAFVYREDRVELLLIPVAISGIQSKATCVSN